MAVPSRPTAKPCRLRKAAVAESGRRLFCGAAFVFFARELIHRRILHNVFAGQLPGLLHDPRQRAILSGRFVLNLLQHLFGKIETLFALVRTSHLPSRDGKKSANTSYPSREASVNG